jgi:hypothetical protein
MEGEAWQREKHNGGRTMAEEETLENGGRKSWQREKHWKMEVENHGRGRIIGKWGNYHCISREKIVANCYQEWEMRFFRNSN